MTNTLPPAIIEFDHSNPVDFQREVSPILGDLVIGHLRKQHELSGRNGSSYTLVEVGQVTEPSGAVYAITEHDYGQGRELECTCTAFESGRPCAHVRAFEARAVPA